MRTAITLLILNLMLFSLNAQVQLGNTIDFSADGGNVIDISMNAQGNIVAFGNPLFQGTRGKVKVYAYDGNSWIQLGNDLIGQTTAELFGFDLELNASGNRLVVGANQYSSTGKVQVFEFDGTEWVQLGDDILPDYPSGVLGQDVSISSDGNTVVAGDTSVNIGGLVGAGQVTVYEFDGNNWEQKGQHIDGNVGNAALGRSQDLDADGNRLVVGAATANSNTGYVELYEYDGSSWVLLAQVQGPALSDFGIAVALNNDGSQFGVNDTGSDVNGTNSGATWIYEYDGTDLNQVALLPGPGEEGFLWRLSMNDPGDMVVAPSTTADYGAQMFKESNGEWLPVGDEIEDAAFADFNASGSRIAVSSFPNIIIYDLSTLGATGFSDEFDITVYPNPTSGTVFIESNLIDLQAEVYDLAGRRIYAGIPGEQLSLNQFVSGIYLLHLSEGTKQVVFKIIKQ